MGFHKKIVALITLFFAGISGVFLVTKTGAPALRLMVGVIFFISVLNLSLCWREFGQWLKRTAHTARDHLAEARDHLKDNLAEARKARLEEKDNPAPEETPFKTKELKRTRQGSKIKPNIKGHFDGQDQKYNNDDDFQDDDFDMDDDDFEFEEER